MASKMADGHQKCDIFASIYGTITNKVSKYMFFETRKLMESSNLSYMHDLPAKFQNGVQNGHHASGVFSVRSFVMTKSLCIFM